MLNLLMPVVKYQKKIQLVIYWHRANYRSRTKIRSSSGQVYKKKLFIFSILLTLVTGFVDIELLFVLK
jgi:hypothetical protein